MLGYTAEAAVNEDHLIVGQRVTQNAADNHQPDPAGGRSGAAERSEGGEDFGRRWIFLTGKYRRVGKPRVGCVLAGFESGARVEHGAALSPIRLSKTQRRMRQKLRGPTGQAVYRRRKALVEPVWGTLKEQRGMRRFRLRGLEKVNIEFTLAAISFNLTRLLAHRQPGATTLTATG